MITKQASGSAKIDPLMAAFNEGKLAVGLALRARWGSPPAALPMNSQRVKMVANRRDQPPHGRDQDRQTTCGGEFTSLGP